VEENNIDSLLLRVKKASSRGLKSGLDKPKADGIAFKLISDLLAGLLVGGVIGYNLDEKFDTKPFLLLILMILGIASGFYSFYKHELKRDVEK
jgi:ATP synthase protein I